MTFTPAVIFGGLGGFRVFEATAPRQRDAFEQNPTTQRALDYFRENISNARTAQDLVADRRLLEVSLAAYGLSEEIDKRAFIRRILEDGVDDPRALANRLGDTRWRDFAAAFGYGDIAGPRVDSTSFRTEIAERFLERAFEARVGDIEPDFRLALNFRREIAAIANSETVDRSGWLRVIGNRPLRTVLEAALGLPTSAATLDVDQQRSIFERRALSVFGSSSLSLFNDPEVIEDAIRRFFVRRDLETGPDPSTPGATSLALLNSSNFVNVQSTNILLSNLI